MDDFITYLGTSGLGDLASVLGVIISIIGFAITAVAAIKSKNAAQQAETIANNLRNDLRQINTIADFTSAISIMNEIKRLHRHDAWRILPDRYASLRRYLISIKISNPDLSDEHKELLQSTIQHFSNFERQVEEALKQGGNLPLSPKLNSIISKQSDKLQELLVELKNSIGERHVEA